MKARKSTTPAKALKATAKTRRTPKAANRSPGAPPGPQGGRGPGPRLQPGRRHPYRRRLQEAGWLPAVCEAQAAGGLELYQPGAPW